MLDSAKSDYFASQFTLALSGFEAILRTFPRTESASEAQFYIGETYSSQQRWMDAIAAYTLVVAELPQLRATCPRRTTSAGGPTRTWARAMPPGRRGSW